MTGGVIKMKLNSAETSENRLKIQPTSRYFVLKLPKKFINMIVFVLFFDILGSGSNPNCRESGETSIERLIW